MKKPRPDKSAARMRRHRERLRRGVVVVPNLEVPVQLAEHLIDIGYAAPEHAQDPSELGRAIIEAAEATVKVAPKDWRKKV